MPAYPKAKLQPVDTDANETPIGTPIEVQFNPSTLRLSMATVSDVGATVGRQTPQYLGTPSATLSLELVFDTADEGTTDAPRSVLEKTTPIQRLLLPQGDKQSPPKIRFEWGPFTLTGVTESLNLDLELFSENGVPLRAKIALSIREQRSDLEFGMAGPGANSEGNAVPPTRAGLGAVGGIGIGASFNAGLGLGVGLDASLSFSAGAGVQTALAIEGESAAGFAARVGVDPAAWRAIAAGQAASPLSLPGGAAIDFSTGISAGTGLGARVGTQANPNLSPEAAFGLEPAGGAAGLAHLGAPGFALADAGGAGAAVDAVARIRSEQASDATRHAFAAALPGAGAGGSARTAPAASTETHRPAAPEQPRVPLRSSGFPSYTARARAAATPQLPRPDSRATTFGLSVPLRPRAALDPNQNVTTLAQPPPRRTAGACGCGRCCGCRSGGLP
jgi:hypothetical protein